MLLGLFAGWAALGWSLSNLGWLATHLCSPDFALPDMACRFAAAATQILLIPLAACASGFIAWFLLSRNGRTS
ncbi:MAG: hypothetical protein QM569_05935 [Acidovorax sp.]|uniref:hypothetical protein n=1 Tax=Acidovorax sp. TaxID=1872122 RepID=UPI0039E40116